VRRALSIALALASLAVGCGGDDESATPSTITVSTTTSSTSTTPGQPAPGSEEGGGEDAPPTPSQQLSVPETVEAALTGGPCEIATDQFLARAYGGRGGCLAAVESGGVAESVEISAVNIDGDNASAVAIPNGGPSSGERIHVRLVRVDDAWLIDDLKSNVPAGP
jgi:hypothetical protein